MNLSGTPPFELGETMIGVDRNDSTKLVNTEHVGKVYLMKSQEPADEGLVKKGSGNQVWAICLRNTHSAALSAGDIAALVANSGGDVDSLFKEAVLNTTAGNDLVVAVDDKLPSAGVAVNSLFWGIIKGRTSITTTASAVNIAAGGRVTTATDGALESAGTVNDIATALEAQTTSSTAVEVNMHVPWY